MSHLVDDDSARIEVANRIFFGLYQAANLMHRQGARAVADYGATTQQWALLGALARPIVRHRGMSVKALVSFLDLSRQNLNPVLERLEARGWIERRKGEGDGRERVVFLSEDGAAVWAQMIVDIDAFYGRALSQLSFDDQLALFRLLEKLKIGLTQS